MSLAPTPRDAIPRTAIMSAFDPEWPALAALVADPHEHIVVSTRFLTGTIAGQPVVIFLSGMSMVNAAMATQLAIDHFRIERIVFTGIAGGVDPTLDIGDVVVPERWAHYAEATYARADGEGFAPPHDNPYATPDLPGHGMIFPRAAHVRVAGGATIEKRMWFEVDADLLALAHRVAPGVTLDRGSGSRCLAAAPRVVVGGAGVSGAVFIDNAGYRGYLAATFAARIVDMESAAVAHVSRVNRVPFIAFRSLSDLAGGDEDANQVLTFFGLAAENSAAMVAAFVAALP